MPVELSRLPSIVEKCAAIYRQREAARIVGANMAAGSSSNDPRQTAPKARPGAANSSGNQAGQLSAAQLENVTGHSVLQSGKYKGHAFEKVMRDYPEYADWIIAQTKNLVEVSLRQFRHYVGLQRGRGPTAYMVNEHPPSEDYLLAVLDSGCNQTCHGALWMKKFVEASGHEFCPLRLRGRPCGALAAEFRPWGSEPYLFLWSCRVATSPMEALSPLSWRARRHHYSSTQLFCAEAAGHCSGFGQPDGTQPVVWPGPEPGRS